MRSHCYTPDIMVVQGELGCTERLSVYTLSPNAPKPVRKEMLTRRNVVLFFLSVLIDEVWMPAGDIGRISTKKGKAVGVSATKRGL